jgi:hypothetical protein
MTVMYFVFQINSVRQKQIIFHMFFTYITSLYATCASCKRAPEEDPGQG